MLNLFLLSTTYQYRWNLKTKKIRKTYKLMTLPQVLAVVANLADRIPPRRLVLYGSIGAAAANAVVIFGGSFEVGIVARLLTGACLAGVYPAALKSMSSWFREGRGLALGVMIGALTGLTFGLVATAIFPNHHIKGTSRIPAVVIGFQDAP